jgi:hypothetical protein
MPHKPRTPNFMALAQVLHTEGDTRHIRWVRRWISTHNTMYLPTESCSRLVCIWGPHPMNRWGLICINTYSVCQQVVVEPILLWLPRFLGNFRFSCHWYVIYFMGWCCTHSCAYICSVHAVFTTPFGCFIVIFTAALCGYHNLDRVRIPQHQEQVVLWK